MDLESLGRPLAVALALAGVGGATSNLPKFGLRR
jgi:hypothetical protein